MRLKHSEFIKDRNNLDTPGQKFGVFSIQFMRYEID